MRYRLCLVLSIILFIFNINYVKADVCDKEDIERLKQVANSISVSYDFPYDLNSIDLAENDVEENIDTYGGEGNNDSFIYGFYHLYVYGLTDEVYVNVEEDDAIVRYENVRENGDAYTVVSSGDKKIEIISVKCNIVLRVVNLELPFFNIYSQYEECDGLDIEVCDAWYDGNDSYDTFKNGINNYYDGLKNKDDNKFDISKYYVYIFGGSVILILFIILFFAIRRKRSVLE